MKKQKIRYYYGFQKRFQGLGIMLSWDEPYSIIEYWSFEIKFLWFKAWITVDKRKSKPKN